MAISPFRFYDWTTQLTRAVILTFLILLVYYYAIPRIEASTMLSRPDLAGSIVEDVVRGRIMIRWWSGKRNDSSNSIVMLCCNCAVFLGLASSST